MSNREFRHAYKPSSSPLVTQPPCTRRAVQIAIHTCSSERAFNRSRLPCCAAAPKLSCGAEPRGPGPRPGPGLIPGPNPGPRPPAMGNMGGRAAGAPRPAAPRWCPATPGAGAGAGTGAGGSGGGSGSGGSTAPSTATQLCRRDSAARRTAAEQRDVKRATLAMYASGFMARGGIAVTSDGRPLAKGRPSGVAPLLSEVQCANGTCQGAARRWGARGESKKARSTFPHSTDFKQPCEHALLAAAAAPLHSLIP